MTALVFSVHADDGIFSCGEWIANQVASGVEVMVASICAETPEGIDPSRQTNLNAEHVEACAALGAEPEFLGWYDGKWGGDRDMDFDIEQLRGYIAEINPSSVLVPMGIHHPDHQHFALACLRAAEGTGRRIAVYEDLPYRVLYPDQAYLLRRAFESQYGATLESAASGGFYEEKLTACWWYRSQWAGDAVRCCLVPERIWWL